MDALVALDHGVLIRAGPRDWDIFGSAVKRGVSGKRVADAVHAAVAIESGCEWLSADSDSGRFGQVFAKAACVEARLARHTAPVKTGRPR